MRVWPTHLPVKKPRFSAGKESSFLFQNEFLDVDFHMAHSISCSNHVILIIIISTFALKQTVFVSSS